MLLATANAANTEEVSYENVCQSRMPLILIQITPLLFAASYQMTTRPNAHPLVVVSIRRLSIRRETSSDGETRLCQIRGSR